MPKQSSLAAGVLQTAMRLSVSLGLSVTAAVYGSVSQTPQGREDTTLPFERAYFCSILFAVIGLLFIPFMRIGKQGGKTPPNSFRSESSIEDQRPRTSNEYRDRESDEEEKIESQRGLGSKASMSSMWSGATAGSEASYFPRWSWEGDREWGIDSRKERYAGAKVVYEVCVKCLQERRVTLAELGRDGTDALLPHDEEPRLIAGGDPRANLQDVEGNTDALIHSTQGRSVVAKDSADTLVEHDYRDLRAGYGPGTAPDSRADLHADNLGAHRYAHAYAEGIQRNAHLNVEINGPSHSLRTCIRSESSTKRAAG